jgi:hypothetical protein
MPLIAIAYITAPQRVSSTYPGMVRIEPGHSYVTDAKTASKNILTQRALIAETLNRKLANIAFNDRIKRQKIKMSQPETLIDIVDGNDTHEMEELLRMAKAKNIIWEPTAGEYGMFLLGGDKPPENMPIFGKVDIPGGKEKSTFLVERNLNLILNWAREKRKASERKKVESIEGTLKEVLNQEDSPINPQEAVELYALSKGLNIKYDKKIGLFLSPESQIKFLPWIPIESK